MPPAKNVPQKHFSKKFPEKTWLFVSLLLMGFLAGTLTYLFSPKYNVQATLMNTPLPKIFEKDGSTYVAFPHPLIHIDIVSSAECSGVICDLNKAFYDFQRNISYAAEAQAFDKNSEKGKELIEKYQLSALPAFLVDKNVEYVPHFSEYKKYFEDRGDRYLMITPVGELLNDFEVGENGEIVNPEEDGGDDSGAGEDTSEVEDNSAQGSQTENAESSKQQEENLSTDN